MTSAVAVAESVHVSAADLSRIRELYDRGLYLQAYGLAQDFGPLKDWHGTEARLLAGRLAGCLGGARLGAWHFIKAWRGDPGHADASWFYARYLLDARGPLPAWQLVKRLGLFPEAAPLTRALWLAAHACIFGRLRDFDAADRWMQRAQEIGVEHPWLPCERSGLLILEDRLDEALEAARESLRIRPWYRPAVQSAAHLLVQRERDTEALELLGEAAQHLESSAVWAQLAALQAELKQYAQARQSVEEFARLSPLLEKDGAQWLAARRSDAAYFCGDLPQALEHAKQATGPFFEHIAQRLTAPVTDARRVQLPVPFVRQHHHTCVPATLAALTRFWSMPAEHLEVAAAICYDGTPHHSERRWAEDNGWAAREFTVTWDSAVALLERGIPFTLTTSDPGNAHLQAVIGYDGVRGTLLVRDPGERHQGEFLADAFFQRYRSTGPRGMALVPRTRADLLDNLTLPDAELYDHMYRLQRALQIHHRDEAEESCRAMQALADNHYLTWLARRSLAQYDADVGGLLACADGLLGLFPDDVGWQLAKVGCLRQLGRRDERLAVLKGLAERRPADPISWQQYAQELAADAREHATAIHLLRVAMRANPFNAGNYSILARLRWDQRRLDAALELDHFAACLEDKDEGLAQNYFISARCLGKTAETLSLLRERFQRLGGKSGQPARTLCWAYGQLDRITEAFAVLEEAIRLRPEDGDLRLYAAEAQGNYGYFERARALLQSAEGCSQRTAWLRTAALLANLQGDLPGALALWQQVLLADPLHLEAHQAAAQLLAETAGRAAALEHLQQACTRLPHHYALTKLWIEWLREDGPAAVEPVARRLLDIHPVDAWARRELALTLADQGRLEPAFQEMDLAERFEPPSAVSWTVRARLLTLAGRIPYAKEAYRQAIRLSADHDLAIRELVAACDTLAQRREALAFVVQELKRQVIFGNGLLAFRDLALYTLEAEELIATLQEALDARPDLWHAWSAVIRQLTDMKRLDDALVLARQAVERFPLLPALWLDLAWVYRQAKEHAGEIEVLQKALEINASWGPPLRQLAEAYEAEGKLDQARELLELSLARTPLVALNHGSLADILWKSDQKEAALERIQHALRLDPGYEWAWGRLNDWGGKMGRPDVVLDCARDLTVRRPGEARSWLMLARFQTRPENATECLQALERALALNPRCAEAYDLKADTLARQQQYAEALEACRPPAFAGQPPLMLRGRAAWVVAQQGNFAEAIQQMKGVLAEDTNYYWAWSQLAEWCQATGDFEQYLRAAEELVRLAPDTAVPLGYRGEARLRLNNRAGGKEDLKKALELAPDYAFAGMTLFDAQLADNELEEAGRTLERLKDHTNGPYVEARAVQLWARRGDQKLASKVLWQLCDAQGDATWPLDAAFQAMVQAGWVKRANKVLRAAVKKETCNPYVAVLWAQQDGDGAVLDDRVQAIDRALGRAPDYFRAYDLKAELLVRAGRLDEALAACTPPGVEPPVFLRGRQAWIERERGNVGQAVQQMEKLVELDPQYYWGWQQLAVWYGDQGHTGDMLRAAERLIQLAPADPLGYNVRAGARHLLGDRAGTKEDYRRCVELAPDWSHPAFQLFDLHLDDGELPAAEELLERVRPHCPPADYHLGVVQLQVEKASRRAGVQGDPTKIAEQEKQKKALGALGELCAPTIQSATLDSAVQMLVRAGWSEGVETTLFGHSAESRPAARHWARLALDRRPRPGPELLDVLTRQGEAGRQGLIALAEELGERKRRRPLRGFVKRFSDLFAKDTATWGRIGAAFGAATDDRALADWMADWAKRTDEEPWMLVNLAVALRGLGREQEARQVSERALTLPRDYTSAFHEIWLCLDDALAGHVPSLDERLKKVQDAELDPFHTFVAALVHALRQLLEVEAGERNVAFQEIRQRLAQTAAKSEPVIHERALYRTYRRCVRRLAELEGGLFARLWSFWRRLRPLLPKESHKGQITAR